MADDDEVFDETSLEPESAEPGLRRSTFTPPVNVPTGVPPLVEPPAFPPTVDDVIHDDDELAGALAADFSRVTTGTITLPPAPEPPRVETPPVDVPPAPGFPVGSVPDSAAWVGVPEVGVPGVGSPDLGVPEVGVPEVTPPWTSFPAPNPLEQVDLPGAPPQRPVRRSLPDDQLLQWVDEAGRQPGATLNVIRELEAQLSLREEEAREFKEWEAAMLASGNPDAIAAVEQARPEFTGVLPDVGVPSAGAASHRGPEVPQDSAAPVDAGTHHNHVADGPPDEGPAEQLPPIPLTFEPPPPAELDRDFEPDLESDTVVPPLPVWDISAPSADWSPPPEAGFDDVAGAVSGQVPLDVQPVDLQPSDPQPFDPQPFDPQPIPEPISEPLSSFLPVGEPPANLVEPLVEPVVESANEPLVEPVAELAPEFAPPPLVEPPLYEPTVLPPEVAPPGSALSGEWDVLAGIDPQAFAVPIDAEPPAPIERAMPASAPIDSFSFDDLVGGTIDGAATSGPALDAMPLPLDLASLPAPSPSSIQAIDLAPPAPFGAGSLGVEPQKAPEPSAQLEPLEEPAEQKPPFDRQRVFSLEQSGLEPTPVEQRVGRAARLFWLWFAANSSILSIGLGAAIFALGMSLRQAIVSVLAGVALSVLPLALTTLAGKRSGQPTMVVSRATFGLIGNVIPALLAVVTRLFWGAVLLWLLASSVAVLLVGAGVNGAIGERQLLLISLAAGFLIALLVAFAGYPLFARIQLILSVVSGALVVGLIALTWRYVNIGNALTTQDGPWLLTITGAVLVFSFVGMVWATGGADLARYQRVGSSGASNMLWASFGTTLPTLVLIGYGALLAASDPGIASGFVLSPLDTLAHMLPSWYPVPLLAATALSLLSGVVLSLYSGGFALQAVGLRVQRQWSIVILALPLGIVALVLTFGLTGGINELFRDAATTLAVPTAAWVGIFGAETMIRNRRYEPQSLLRRGGIYPTVRWVNLVGLVVASALGYGLTTATVSWLHWQGFLLGVLTVAPDSALAASDFGVLVALGIGLLIPIVAGIPAIRRQESAEVGTEPGNTEPGNTEPGSPQLASPDPSSPAPGDPAQASE